MAVAYAEIARVLAGARRRQGQVIVAAALGFGLSGALACLLMGAIALGLGASAPARAVFLAGALVSLVAAAAWAVRALLRKAWGPAATARTVAGGDPSLRSDLLTSVELERARPELEQSGRFSLALVDAHIERTAARTGQIDLASAIPSRWARRAGLALAGVVAANLAALAFMRVDLTHGYGRLARGDAGPPARPSRPDPITGDIELTYLYPAHMGRPAKKLSGTGGELSAPKGTEVRLETRSDRPVAEAQIVISVSSAFPPVARELVPRPGGGRDAALQDSAGGGQGAAPKASAGSTKTFALSVANGRALAGRFVVEEGGSYRFRFLREGKVVAEGPPIPIVVEPDEFPQVHITAPVSEIEVDAKARVQVGWNASDDYGLSDLTLVLKPPAGEEQRRPIRTFSASRRDSGSFDLDLAPLRLAEGEKLLYWLEVRDNDAVSGPKRGASATQVVKIYSEAEHHRAMLEKAQALWEEMVRLLGDRLEQLPSASDRLALGEALDTRARQLQERMRDAAAEIRREPAAPRELAAALANVASGVRTAADRVSAARQTFSRLLRLGRDADPILARRVADLDEEMNRELEKDVLYLEALFDKRRGEDLVRLAKDLAARRRDLASLLEKYRSAPSEQGKKELLAEISRLRQRMQDLLRRMGELAKGIGDQHMNAEALAELAKSKDLMGSLERLEQQLARGDLDSAMKELDALGSAMQEMLSSLQRTAGLPGEQNAALMKEMLAFKKQLEEIQAEQERLASQTEQVKAEYRRRIADRMRQAEPELRRLEQLARKAREEVQQSERGISIRSDEDFAQSRGRLEDAERALAMRDLDASLDSVRRALPAMQRLAAGLEDDAVVAERYRALNRKDPAEVREAQRHAQAALPPARKLREDLERLFPDPRGVLGKGDQSKLDRLSKRQDELEHQAGGLQQRLQELMQKAPIFPQSAGQTVGESRGHMQQAAEDLARKNPQRGHGQQMQALEALGRLQRGLEEMARRGGGQGGGGFPLPFAEAGSGTGESGGIEPSQEKVEIPGADAYRVPEEFRKDLLEAMKQGTPEPYQGEVQRYYQELVK
jgi:hypothetical protein